MVSIVFSETGGQPPAIFSAVNLNVIVPESVGSNV